MGPRLRLPLLLLVVVVVVLGSPVVGARTAYRNGDDRRRARLTKKKTQHIERVLRYADSGDGNARLEALDLYDAGAALTAGLITEQYPDLIEIELDDNAISDASAPDLARAINASHGLRVLHMDGNELSGDGMTQLAGALIGSKIRHLYLNDNLLGDSGAVAVASVIQRSKSLREVSLKRNGIGVDGGAALLQAVRSSNSPLLQHVRVQGNGQGVAALQQDIEEALLLRLRGGEL